MGAFIKVIRSNFHRVLRLSVPRKGRNTSVGWTQNCLEKTRQAACCCSTINFFIIIIQKHLIACDIQVEERIGWGWWNLKGVVLKGGGLDSNLASGSVPLSEACVSHSVVSNTLLPHGMRPARLLPLSMEFSRQYWSGLPFPSPGDLPDPGIEPRSPALQAVSLLSEPLGNSYCRQSP